MAVAKKIDHIAIAVKDLDAALQTFGRNFAFPRASVPEENPQERRAGLTIGDSMLQLLQPAPAGTQAAEFLQARGEGMYVLSLEVEDLDAAVAHLASKGIAATPQDGPGGTRCCNVSPEVTHGVPLQLVQHRRT